MIKQDIISGKYDDNFNKIYCGVDIEKQKSRYIAAIDSFYNLYSTQDISIFSASGRTEICGNHTDHQNGCVLTASVNLDAIAVAGKTGENKIRITSEGHGTLEIDCGDVEIKEAEKGTTAALVRGVAGGFIKRGYAIGGFDAYITSDVLSGSGLSSSAAFEVLVANILSGLFNNSEIDAVEIAKIGKEAENMYFGKPSGLLDQTASSVGGLINIDFSDMVVNKIDVDFNSFGYTLCVVDTKGSHADLTDEYAAITEEMGKVSDLFGKKLLSEIDENDFFEAIPKVRAAAGDRAVLRAIHFFEENKRVNKQVKALIEGNFDEFLSLVAQSGNSSYKYLQNVYACGNPRSQNVSVALAVSESILGKDGVARVHGGGFAGTIQAFVKNEKVSEYKEKIEKIFGENSCYILKIRPIGGTKFI